MPRPFDPFDPRTWKQITDELKPGRYPRTEQARACLWVAHQMVEEALAALTNPDFFEDEPDLEFNLWEDRVNSWRQLMDEAMQMTIAAIAAVNRAKLSERLSPPRRARKRRPSQPPED